ncbi:TPA: hypothetical protein ACYLN4_001142 [Burkholderia lata]
MTCVCDITDARIELESQLALDAIRRQVNGKRELTPNGTCNNPDCQLPVQPEQIFCNSTCSKEYEQLKAAGMLPPRLAPVNQ